MPAGKLTSIVPPKGGDFRLPNPPLPRAFSRDHLTFDAEPPQEQLLAMLGSTKSDGAIQTDGTIQIKETAELLTVRPLQLRMRFIAPFLIIVACGVSIGFWFDREAPRPISIIVIFVVWLAIVPTLLGIFYWISRRLAELKDFVVADKIRQTLLLPSAGITLGRAQICYLVELDRWCKRTSQWKWLRQTAVLAKRDGGGFGYYLIAHAPASVWGGHTVAKKLAEIFKVNIRQVNCSRAQSCSLHDCD